MGNDFFHTEEEAELKSIVWRELNRDYLENQTKRTTLAQLHRYTPTASIVSGQSEPFSSRSVRPEFKESTLAQSAETATHQLLKHKQLSSHVNYNAILDLFR